MLVNRNAVSYRLCSWLAQLNGYASEHNRYPAGGEGVFGSAGASPSSFPSPWAPAKGLVFSSPWALAKDLKNEMLHLVQFVWHHFDPLGTAGVITNGSASVVSNNLYDVFGMLR